MPGGDRDRALTIARFLPDAVSLRSWIDASGVRLGHYVRARDGSGCMENEGWKVHGNEAVKSKDRELVGIEGENHVPYGGCIENGKSCAQAT